MAAIARGLGLTIPPTAGAAYEQMAAERELPSAWRDLDGRAPAAPRPAPAGGPEWPPVEPVERRRAFS